MAFLERVRDIFLRRGSIVAFTSGLATMIGLLAALLSSYQVKVSTNDQKMKAEVAMETAERYKQQLDLANMQMKQLEDSSRAIQQALGSLKHSGESIKFSALDPSDRQRIDEIGAAESKLDGRLSVLENALMASPEKAVAVPMLKQELDALQDRTHGDLDAIRGEIGRLFTLTQWFIGLMFTIALGMFGLSFNLRKASAPAAEKP
jgi:hypothetical protein